MNEIPFTPPLAQAFKQAIQYLSAPERTQVAATATLEQLRQRLSRPLADDGLEAVQVIDDLVADTAGGLNRSTGGRFFGWAIGGALPAALAADWLASTWDQNAALYSCSPAAAVLEEVCGRWLKELLGLPASASFALVTGCQMAHVTCLAAARHALMARCGWDVEQDGLAGAPPLRILTSDQRHGSIERAIRLLGLGSRNVMPLPVDENGCLPVSTLHAALQASSQQPTIVLLQAGDLNIGAFDDFAELIPLAHEHQSWVHVDGAFGLWVAASPRYRHLLTGIESADSWATDGHKWLNVPYDAGYAVIAHPDAHRAAVSHRASYLTHDADARDQIDWNPDWSRRARGIATYAALRSLGRRGVADLIERTCRLAHTLVMRLSTLPGAELLWEPRINQGLVRFPHPRPAATEHDHERYTDEVIAAILQDGSAFFTGTTWRNKRCMRVSVLNWQTSEADIDCVIETVARVLSQKRAAHGLQPINGG